MGKTFRRGLPRKDFHKCELCSFTHKGNFQEGVDDLPSRQILLSRRERHKVIDPPYHIKGKFSTPTGSICTTARYKGSPKGPFAGLMWEEGRRRGFVYR